MITIEDFLEDNQGVKFKDVIYDDRFSFNEVISFFNNDARRIRLCDAESHHNRPPLAGVIKEFESQPPISKFFESSDGHSTQRFRQSIGVLVRLHMEQMGWRKAERRGSLGTRKRVESGTTDPGAYRNNHGLSIWFTSAKRYELLDS